jgi:hypothetical protein
MTTSLRQSRRAVNRGTLIHPLFAFLISQKIVPSRRNFEKGRWQNHRQRPTARAPLMAP